MALRGWRPAAAALAAGRPRGGDPGGASAPGTGPGPEPGAPGGAVTAALYVHWPYCRKHCSYCSFNKYVVPAVDEAAVRACLVREARTLLRLGQVQSVTSVFFGGGTPSLASPHTIAAVLEAAAEAGHLPAGAEVTLEANPSSASPARLAGFKAAGVNRLSVGVQSLDAAELRLLGREHTVDEARAAVEAARGLFPGRTSIDLLFGLPGQSQEAWAQSLEAALGLCDDHLALYQLTLERGTALEARVRRGALPAPPQDLLADMYHTARAVLAAAGFRQYEVSNFARKGALSTHNLSYWRAEQYVGVGPGAHGRFVPWGEGSRQREARVQTPDPDAWMREVQSRGHGTRRRVALSPLEQLEELLALGLRTDEGITQQRWGLFSPQLPLRAVFGGPGEAMALQQQGWLLLDGRGLRCTPQGLAVLDSLLPALLCQLQRTAGTGGRGTEGRGGQGQEAAGGQGPEAHGGQDTEAAGEQGTAPHGGHGTEAGREQGP
ncbi:radical S-adenosyl methionine domain-containing protein 1, mitochondrial isoform X2 [Anas platyrhynchos]|uniref:radical S-adenosyl methionine domain-containing protein 1, mitochondrial isoform X2 n=1 Tax=Anas platyrhynchos TaxID=8839 RepID=UPI003AF2DB18